LSRPELRVRAGAVRPERSAVRPAMAVCADPGRWAGEVVDFTGKIT
jgi:hypothetical protein